MRQGRRRRNVSVAGRRRFALQSRPAIEPSMSTPESMFSVTLRPGASSNALEHARRWLIKRRLPLFGLSWLGTLALWEIVLSMEERVGEGPVVVIVAAQ